MSDRPGAFVWASLAASVALQFGFWTCASGLKMDKVTDLAYGLNFILVAVGTLLWAGLETPDGMAGVTVRQYVVSLSVVAWGVRLAGYLFYRILKIGEDKRFDSTRGVWWKFLIWFMLQAITTWIVLLPVILLNAVGSGRRDCSAFSEDDCPRDKDSKFDVDDVHPIDIVGYVLFSLGLIVEAVGDCQKFLFKLDDKNRGKWIESGLWKYSRHPNYCGEVTCWWGLMLPCAVVFEEWYDWLTLIGPIYITVVIMCGSGVPTTEKAADERYWHNDEYQRYKRNTAVCCLFPPVLGHLPSPLRSTLCCEWKSLYESIPDAETGANERAKLDQSSSEESS